MGQHKNNPIAQLAREGKLPPRTTRRLSKREIEAELQAALYSYVAQIFYRGGRQNGKTLAISQLKEGR